MDRRIFDAAAQMAANQSATLEEGAWLLIRSGVPLADLEVVHETYTPPEADGTKIYQRAYVRARDRVVLEESSSFLRDAARLAYIAARYEQTPALPEGWEWTEKGARAHAIGSVGIDGDRLHIEDGCDGWGPLPAVAAALAAHTDPSWQVHIGRESDGVSLVRIIDGDVWLADPSNARAPIEVVRAVLARFG
jgi:hypothetical protein